MYLVLDIGTSQQVGRNVHVQKNRHYQLHTVQEVTQRHRRVAFQVFKLLLLLGLQLR